MFISGKRECGLYVFKEVFAFLFRHLELLKAANKKIASLQDNIIKAKAEESAAKATAKETRAQVTSTWQLKVQQVEQELQGKITKLIDKNTPNNDTIKALKLSLEEHQHELQLSQKQYRKTATDLSKLTFQHGLLKGQADDFNSIVKGKDADIKKLKDIIASFDIEQQKTKRHQATCTMEGKKYDKQSREWEYKRAKHESETSDIKQQTKFELEQKAKDKDLKRQNDKKAFENSTRGSHLKAISDDARTNPTGRFPAMNAMVPGALAMPGGALAWTSQMINQQQEMLMGYNEQHERNQARRYNGDRRYDDDRRGRFDDDRRGRYDDDRRGRYGDDRRGRFDDDRRGRGEDDCRGRFDDDRHGRRDRDDR